MSQGHSHPCTKCRVPILHMTGEPCRIQELFPKRQILFVCGDCLMTEAAYDWKVV